MRSESESSTHHSYLLIPHTQLLLAHQVLGHGFIGGNGGGVDVLVAGLVAGGKAGNDHLGGGVDVDGLAVDTPCHVGPMAVIGNPPQVLVAPALQQRILATSGKGLLAASRTNHFNSGSGNNLAAPQSSTIPKHLTEDGHVPQVQVKATSGVGGSGGVNHKVAVVHRSHGLPD